MSDLEKKNDMIRGSNQININGKTVNVFGSFDDELKDNVFIASGRLLDPQYVKNNSGSIRFEKKDGKEIVIRPQIKLFDGVRTIYIIQKNKYFLVMYNNLEARDRDIVLHQKSNTYGASLQSPEVIGYFDEENKYFLILRARYPLEGDTNYRTYKGMIINPNLQSDILSDSYSENISDVLG